MITLPRLLNSLILLSVLVSASAFAANKYCPATFDVLERDDKDGYTIGPKQLERLFCTKRFEGEFFKIVKGTDETAISFDDEDKEIIKKAANVYHHLSIARNYWINDIKSKYVASLPQLVIRLDITNAFSNTRHFKNQELEKNYNNAWSVPEGETPKFVKDKLKWNKEIWFSPMKKIETRNIVKSDGNNPVHESLTVIKDPVVQYNKNALIYQGLGLLAAPTLNNNTLVNVALQRLGTIAVLFGLVSVTKHMDLLFMDKYYYVDTAMVPEIIYHEFAHIALSDTLKPVHSVPVIEGMADYFAATIAKRRKMYEKIEKFSSNKYKDTQNKDMYHPYLEGAWNATSDFTLSLLWLGKTRFEELNEGRSKRGQTFVANYDNLVHEAHFTLNENSTIANDLTAALINACTETCTSLRVGVGTLHEVFEQKGFN